MAPSFFDDVKQYLQFGPDDEAALRSVRALVAPAFDACTERFYAHITAHPPARAVLEAGESRVGHLKVTLKIWLQQLFDGPWDEAYFERRMRIGRVHVRIKLPQQYMVTAMHGLREQLLETLIAAGETRAVTALTRLIDLELCIMMQSYQEQLLSDQSAADRHSTVKVLVGGVGHELRNPLSVIASSAHLARLGLSDVATVEKHLGRIETNAARAQEILSSLIDVVRESPVERRPVMLQQTVSEALAQLQWPQGITLDRPPVEPPVKVSGDAVQLRQVLVNLLQNALDALKSSGRISIALEPRGPQVLLHVDDSGPGIAAEIAGRLFDPLVTTRAGGVGLGLTLVKRLTERHGGTVQTSTSPLGGARFTVSLPVEAE